MKRECIKKWGFGLLGGFVGALVGIALWGLVAGVLGGNLHLSTGIFMGGLVYAGCLIGMKGKVPAGGIWLVTFLSLVGLCAGFLLGMSVVLLHGYGLLGGGQLAALAAGEGASVVGLFIRLVADCVTVLFDNKAYLLLNLTAALIYTAIGTLFFCRSILVSCMKAEKAALEEKEPAPEEEPDSEEADQEDPAKEEAGEEETEESPRED